MAFRTTVKHHSQHYIVGQSGQLCPYREVMQSKCHMLGDSVRCLQSEANEAKTAGNLTERQAALPPEWSGSDQRGQSAIIVARPPKN
jgi:hypothetical protein